MALIRSYSVTFWLAGLLRLLNDLVAFAQPLILAQLLTNLAQPPAPKSSPSLPANALSIPDAGVGGTQLSDTVLANTLLYGSNGGLAMSGYNPEHQPSGKGAYAMDIRNHVQHMDVHVSANTNKSADSIEPKSALLTLATSTAIRASREAINELRGEIHQGDGTGITARPGVLLATAQYGKAGKDGTHASESDPVAAV